MFPTIHRFLTDFRALGAERGSTGTLWRELTSSSAFCLK